MKRITLILICVFFPLLGKSAELSIKVSGLKEEHEGFYFWTVYSLKDTNEVKSGFGTTSIQISPGKYFLKWGDFHKIIKVGRVGLKDTLYFPSLIYLQQISNPPSGNYSYGDSIPDGRFEEKDHNGRLMFVGNFDKGQIKDSLIAYYPNGKIKERRVRDGGRVYFESYFSNGVLKHRYYKKGRQGCYNNGKLAYSETPNRNKTKYYYDSGILKTRISKKGCLSYYKNGKLKDRIKRKRSLGSVVLEGGQREKFYKYTWKKFNKHGELVFKIKFLRLEPKYNPIWHSNDVLEMDDIESISWYKNGGLIKHASYNWGTNKAYNSKMELRTYLNDGTIKTGFFTKVDLDNLGLKFDSEPTITSVLN